MSRAQVTAERVAAITARWAKTKPCAEYTGLSDTDICADCGWSLHCHDIRDLLTALEMQQVDLAQSRAETEAADACTEKKQREMEIVWQRMLDEKRRAESAERKLATVAQERNEALQASNYFAKQTADIATERDALKQERNAMRAALEFIQDNTGDPVMEQRAARALGGEEG